MWSLTSDVHYEAVLNAQMTTSKILAMKSSSACAAYVLAVAWCACAIMACGGGGKTADATTPTGPSAPMIPAASIELDEPPQPACVRDNQTTRCEINGTGKNAGPGCAGMVRVTLHVLSGETEVAADRWTLSSRVLMPDGQFTYQFRVAIPNATFTGITGYSRQTEWVNVRC